MWSVGHPSDGGARTGVQVLLCACSSHGTPSNAPQIWHSQQRVEEAERGLASREALVVEQAEDASRGWARRTCARHRRRHRLPFHLRHNRSTIQPCSSAQAEGGGVSNGPFASPSASCARQLARACARKTCDLSWNSPHSLASSLAPACAQCLAHRDGHGEALGLSTDIGESAPAAVKVGGRGQAGGVAGAEILAHGCGLPVRLPKVVGEAAAREGPALLPGTGYAYEAPPQCVTL